MLSFKYALEIFGGIIVLFSVIPLIRHDFWAFRVFEYPRIQKLFLNLLIIILYASLFQISGQFEKIFTAVITANAIYLVYQIFPFTFLAKKALLKASFQDEDNQISIISSNVFQDNKNTAGCLAILEKNSPDLILLLETNQFWNEGTKKLGETYPYQVLVPLENTYGMLLYSKLELIDSEVRYLIDEEIPSIKTQVKLASGKLIQLYCVHPTPPVPGENMYSTERDAELLLVAKEVKDNNMPTIVVGDLNDVAWSYTTNLFAKISGLLDPRKGRGFFNTFHANYPFLRFPLDHVFCSTDFKLLSLKRLENFNSDHFPILIALQYEEQADMEQEEPEADQEEKELAEEKINKVTE
ncbi:endonuclease/exonuclease/phosphatase family protein [Dyadobacter fanqingshengii]|uniref:Endonuclease/exonuclease/phosphatase family protein n=1 Tax=Dyadobacter fanqingshengii TaxID=2906443 RepID=A0A9X1PAT5_9BACT|nr:endonuclease/exonuclease/phosphatase family protein [Dyadobacter fanqingshengii]MCF0041836.1 endonuclease/exonuclease/phosphatase family protein [Dyadobacter fanqingshengii]USJ36455.1 endonuclease/exonuclease/phosphatase family protein [Dyadobacter fanqingshengii]